MTRRERIEARVERRLDWAEGREAKAAVVAAEAARYRGDIAFNTQPGHIPARARLLRREERAFEDVKMAAHHRSRAAGLERQLDSSVYSDDTDAIEALEARIAAAEARREAMKAANAAYRKGPDGWTTALGVSPEVAEEGARNLVVWSGVYPVPFPSYALTNIGARIRADRTRIEEIKRQQARTATAEAAGGVTVEGNEWVRVTFAEKPDRAILDALKAAGFRWGAGSWSGRRDALPAIVTTLAGGQVT